jgi:cell fate (sporulation/competence/biofilm development) regulator YlbF (YheA/YmcA/DUF963 family)
LGFFDRFINNDDDDNAVEEKPEYKFETVVFEAQNVIDEIKSIARSNKIPYDMFDFRVLSTETLFKTYKEENWITFDDSHMAKFHDRDFLLNPELRIRQIHQIELFLKEEESESRLPPLTIGANKNLTKVVVSVKQSINVKYYSKLKEDLINEINKRKIKAGILVAMFDDRMIREVSKIVSEIRVNNLLAEDHVFVACQGIDPEPSINDDLIFRYKLKTSKKKDDENEKIDYKRRGFVQAVNKGDVIIEYIKPQKGTAGRNCKGEYIKVREPAKKHNIDFTISENIIKEEDDERIRFVAGRNGYVSEKNNKYDIQDEMELESISFKETGSIETSVNSDVKINIKESDVFKDAIGPGLTVETTEIVVEGNVANGATVIAKKAKIGGQTHQSSKIISDDANIAVHRGLLEAKVAKIDRLEGGTVVADVVEINQALGGSILAKEVKIDILLSNVQVTALNLIELQKVRGTNNKLIIDPSQFKTDDDLEALNKAKDTAEYEIKQLRKALEEKKVVIAKSKPGIDLAKEKIQELKQQGKKPHAQLLVKIREFQRMIDAHNKIISDIKDKKELILEIRERISSIQSSIFEAKVINKGLWPEYNEIKFVLVSPPVEVSYVTRENDNKHEFKLKNLGDDKFEIERK